MGTAALEGAGDIRVEAAVGAAASSMWMAAKSWRRSPRRPEAACSRSPASKLSPQSTARSAKNCARSTASATPPIRPQLQQAFTKSSLPGQEYQAAYPDPRRLLRRRVGRSPGCQLRPPCVPPLCVLGRRRRVLHPTKVVFLCRPIQLHMEVDAPCVRWDFLFGMNQDIHSSLPVQHFRFCSLQEPRSRAAFSSAGVPTDGFSSVGWK